MTLWSSGLYEVLLTTHYLVKKKNYKTNQEENTRIDIGMSLENYIRNKFVLNYMKLRSNFQHKMVLINTRSPPRADARAFIVWIKI